MPRHNRLSPVALSLPALAGLVFCFILWSSFEVPAQGLSDAQNQFRHGKYENVIKISQDRLNATGSTEWRMLLVRSLLAVGRYDEAHTNALQGADEAPLNIRMLLLARETALFKNDPTGANGRLLELSRLIGRRMTSYQDGDDLVALGEALLLLGTEPRLVLENCFRRAERMSPPPREAFIASGDLAIDKHDFALAADVFRAGSTNFPDDPDMFYGLARAFESGNRGQMLTNIEAALTINPRHIPTLLLLADHLIDAEQYGEAEKQLTLALAVNPFEPRALAYRAVLAHLRNDPTAEQERRTDALKFFQTNPEVDHLIGTKLSQNYRFEEGAAAQKRALAFDAHFVPARRQLAQDLLRLGQSEEGWDLAESVHQEDPYDVTAYNLSVLHDAMEKFQTLTNSNFIVRMSSHEAQLYGDRVLRLLTSARDTLCKKYGIELTRPTVVEIFPEQKDFAVRTFGMPGNPGYLGVCFGSVITANSPASQSADPANWEDVLWHEFCHVVTLSATRNRMPRWLSEGISVYEERQANPTWGEKLNLAYRDMILNGELTPLGKLSSAFLTPKTPQHLQFAYYESSLVIEFLVQQFGLETLKAILSDLRDGKEINRAIADRTAALPEIEKQFAAFARERADHLAPGADLDSPPEHAPEAVLRVWDTAHPENYRVRLRHARELMAAKKWNDAKPVLESLSNSYHGESGSSNPLWLLAVTHRNLNDTNAELATLRKFAQQESAFLALFQRLLEIESTQRDWIAVTNSAERMLAINPLVSLPYRTMASAATALGNNDQAITAYRKLLLLDPADPVDVHFQLARLLHARGDSEEEARRHVLQALEEAPRFRDAQRLLLEIERKSPQPDTRMSTSKN